MTTTYEFIPSTKVISLNFPYSNRYKFCNVYPSDKELFFETYDIPEIAKSVDDKFHQIIAGEEGRWDLISYKHYRTVEYWWLICHANEIRDPFEILPAGTIIRIPSLDYLTTKKNNAK
jgi:hypothetical protein